MLRKHFARVRDSGNDVKKLRDSGIYQKLARDSGSRPPLPDPVYSAHAITHTNS